MCWSGGINRKTVQKAAVHSTQTQHWTVYFMVLGRIGLGEHSTQKLSKFRGKHSFKNDKYMFVSHSAREARGPLPGAGSLLTRV